MAADSRENLSAVSTKVRPVEMSLFPDMVPDKPVGPILKSVFTGSNADLIAAVAPFYLVGSVVDCTYGEGAWWTRYRPAGLVAHDLHKLDGVDFTALPHADSSFDTVCFDPPYVLSGGESSVALSGDAVGFQERYGIGIGRLKHNGAQAFERLLHAGLAEAARVTRRFVLVKCMEFAQGGGADGGFKDVPYLMRRWGEDLGLRTHDVIVHHTGSGPGGHNIFDPKRARRHHSYLLVLTKRASATSTDRPGVA